MDPEGFEVSRPVEVVFPEVGEQVIYAIIDPEDQIDELYEDNNVLTRTITVLPAGDDTTVPVINSIIVNGGVLTTTEQSTEVEVLAEDEGSNASGMDAVSIIEYAYHEGAQRWVASDEDTVTEWYSYTVTPYKHDLGFRDKEKPGMRYVYARARDIAGNISIGNAVGLVNYAPPQAEKMALDRDQFRVFRYEVEPGEAIEVQLEVLSGDGDLYVWSQRTDQSKYVSNADGDADEQIPPIVNDSSDKVTYQVELFGYARSEVRLKVNIEPAAALLQGEVASSTISQTKDQLENPYVPLDSLPALSLQQSDDPVDPPPPAEHRVHLPLIGAE
jgi:hypothetical protein